MEPENEDGGADPYSVRVQQALLYMPGPAQVQKVEWMVRLLYSRGTGGAAIPCVQAGAGMWLPGNVRQQEQTALIDAVSTGFVSWRISTDHRGPTALLVMVVASILRCPTLSDDIVRIWDIGPIADHPSWILRLTGGAAAGGPQEDVFLVTTPSKYQHQGMPWVFIVQSSTANRKGGALIVPYHHSSATEFRDSPDQQ